MTTRVDFYLLPVAEDTAKHVAVCRLAHKAYRLGHRVYILTASSEESAALDRLLWTFEQGSFIPHRIYAGAESLDADTPVLIGHDAPPSAFADVLISLILDAPPFFDRFARLAELVPAQEPERASARERFRFYRDRGCDVQTHQLSP